MWRLNKLTVWRLNILSIVALIVALIGALNWGLVGFFDFDVVAAMFGEMSILSRIVYCVVGIAAVILAGEWIIIGEQHLRHTHRPTPA